MCQAGTVLGALTWNILLQLLLHAFEEGSTIILVLKIGKSWLREVK